MPLRIDLMKLIPRGALQRGDENRNVRITGRHKWKDDALLHRRSIAARPDDLDGRACLSDIRCGLSRTDPNLSEADAATVLWIAQVRGTVGQHSPGCLSRPLFCLTTQYPKWPRRAVLARGEPQADPSCARRIDVGVRRLLITDRGEHGCVSIDELRRDVPVGRLPFGESTVAANPSFDFPRSEFRANRVCVQSRRQLGNIRDGR